MWSIGCAAESVWGVGKREIEEPDRTALHLVAEYKPTNFARQRSCGAKDALLTGCGERVRGRNDQESRKEGWGCPELAVVVDEV